MASLVVGLWSFTSLAEEQGSGATTPSSERVTIVCSRTINERVYFYGVLEGQWTLVPGPSTDRVIPDCDELYRRSE